MPDTDIGKFSVAGTGLIVKCIVISNFQKVTRPLLTLVEIVYITCIIAESVCHVVQE